MKRTCKASEGKQQARTEDLEAPLDSYKMTFLQDGTSSACTEEGRRMHAKTCERRVNLAIAAH